MNNNSKQNTGRRTWEDSFKKVKRAVKKHGTIFLLDSIPYDLWLWLKNQRNYIAINRMSAGKKELLKEIGIMQLPQRISMDEKWALSYRRISFKISGNKAYGNLPVSQLPLMKREQVWLSRQLRLYVNNKLSKERAGLIEKLHIRTSKPGHSTRWLGRVCELRDCGNINAMKKFSDGISVSRWSTQQRKKYKDKKLTNEQIRLLLDAGFDLSGGRWKKTTEK